MPSRRSGRAIVALCGALIVATGVGIRSGAPGAAGTPLVTSIPTPLATSIGSSSGTWATLPMGRTNQPRNTFWQLFFQPAGATSWTDEVGATATATNGGLVLATAAGRPFIAGIRPANLLRFSPLISTTDGGVTWTNGVLPRGLSAHPDSLSAASDGRTLALVNSGADARVLVSSGSLSIWRTLVTARSLATQRGGRSCEPDSVSGVASLDGNPVVGADCARAGVVGIFAQGGGGWTRDGPTLPDALGRGRVQVLTMAGTPTGLSALLGIAQGSGTALVAAWEANGTWAVSSSLTLGPGGPIVSFGPAGGAGYFVLSRTASGATRLAAIDGPDVHWVQLPPPPRHSATIAFAPATASAIEALTNTATTMTVWSLPSGSGNWVKSQVLHVNIKFGSSS